MLNGWQLVGLNVNPGRLIVTLTCWISSGMPFRTVGILYGPALSLVIVSAEVIGSTSIFALTSTQSHGVPCSRSYGPAFAGLTIDRPKGAPPYGCLLYTSPSP